MFGFFLNGLSVFESLWYAIFHVAATKSNRFAISSDADRRSIELGTRGVDLLLVELAAIELVPPLKKLISAS